MLFISSFLLPLAAAALIHFSLAAPVTSPRSDVNTTIPRYIVQLNSDAANAVGPSEDDRRTFLRNLLSDFDALLNNSLVLSWHNDIFNGFSGRFKEPQIKTLMKRKEVLTILRGMSLITTAITILMIKPMNG